MPGKFQAAVELLVEFVDGMVKDTFHGSSKFIAPLAITIFCLVFLENFMDILPGRCIAGGGEAVRYRAPAHGSTADINTTVGMALGVFLLIQYIGIKEKGVGGFFGEWFTAPVSRPRRFGKLLLAPINFMFRVIEEAVRPLSLSMRLFGNMYAGELIFLLIACFTLGAALTHFSTYVLGFGQIVGRSHMDRVSLPHHHSASVHLHGVDNRVRGHCGRETLDSIHFKDTKD